jgi:AcrR family transcriptional regulator
MYHEVMSDRNEIRDPSSTRPYRLGKRADQAATTRARILETAAELLRTGELHDMSIEQLAARAGTTRVTVYRSFGSKSAVLQAITWDVLGRVRLDLIDAAHAEPDVVDAVRKVLYENCRMFDELGNLLPITLELARRDEEIASIIAATYHGRRHRAMERLARRVMSSGSAAPGWSARQIADAMLVLTSYETLETLTSHRGRTPRQAADALFAMAKAFLR